MERTRYQRRIQGANPESLATMNPAPEAADGPPAPKRLLVVCYSFPPANHVASMRGVRIGRAFADDGWEVHILKASRTGSPRDLQVDQTGFHIHEYRPNWLSRALDRRWPRRSLASLAMMALRRAILPDQSWLLWQSLASATRKLGGFGQFDCVISSAFPFVLHEFCRRRRMSGEQFLWIADTRDMWSGSPNRRSLVPARIERNIERRVFRSCDHATFASETTARVYSDRYGIDATVVLNGYGGEVPRAASAPVARSARTMLVHTGILQSGRRNLDPLVEALDGIDAQLLLAGFDSNAIAAQLNRSGVGVPIAALGQIGRPEALRLQSEADFLIVATENSDFHATYTPAKLIEYAFAGKPVIALARENSDVARLVERHRLGVATFDPAKLRRFIMATIANGWPGAVDLDDLTAGHQFGKFVALAQKA